jgi:hypothetical protein
MGRQGSFYVCGGQHFSVFQASAERFDVRAHKWEVVDMYPNSIADNHAYVDLQRASHQMFLLM